MAELGVEVALQLLDIRCMEGKADMCVELREVECIRIIILIHKLHLIRFKLTV